VTIAAIGAQDEAEVLVEVMGSEVVEPEYFLEMTKQLTMDILVHPPNYHNYTK
jgi:hypothetical protein